MMERYLLYDDSCTRCGSIARVVEVCADEWLVSRSLRDRTMRQLLQCRKADWKWRPMLLEFDGRRVRVYSGIGMALRLGVGLGPVRAFRIFTSAG